MMIKTTKDKIFTISIDKFNIAKLSMAMENGVNKVNSKFIINFIEAVNIIILNEDIVGVILISEHKDFCFGMNLELFLDSNKRDIHHKEILMLHKAMYALENSSKIIVSALNGSAINAGYELTLCSQYRIAINNVNSRFGLSDMKFGVIPGIGATQRLPKIIGIEKTLNCIIKNKLLSVANSLEFGLIDDIAENLDKLLKKSKLYILKNFKNNKIFNKNLLNDSFDAKDFKDIHIKALSIIKKKTLLIYDSHKVLIFLLQKSLCLNFEKALKLETKHFFELIFSDQSSAMITTLIKHKKFAENLNKFNVYSDHKIKKIGIIGAGMMGSGLAVVCAKAGYDVILNDVNKKSLDNGINHCKKYLNFCELSKINPSLDGYNLQDSDLIIEAVFEDIKLKHKVNLKVEKYVKNYSIWASNTTEIPITDLSIFSKNKQNFIGMHFFSPVEKMSLVEIIVTKETSNETLSRILDFVRSIKKTPIIVNDGYAFFTSRVFFSYVLEGCQLVSEGHDPYLIELSARKAGMAVGPLQVIDEVSIKLICHAIDDGSKYTNRFNIDGLKLIKKMVNDHNRLGKSVKRGFYDYSRDKIIWPGLKKIINHKPIETGVNIIMKRLMLIQCVEVTNAIDDGILNNYYDADLGAVLGLGFAPQTGGPLKYMDNIGLKIIIKELNKLSVKYGDRYKPSKILISLAEKNSNFFKKK